MMDNERIRQRIRAWLVLRQMHRQAHCLADQEPPPPPEQIRRTVGWVQPQPGCDAHVGHEESLVVVT